MLGCLWRVVDTLSGTTKLFFAGLVRVERDPGSHEMGILLFTGAHFEKRSNVATANYCKCLEMLKLTKIKKPVKLGTRSVIHKAQETVNNFWGFHFVKFMLRDCC
jgi:hypothetical protein